MRKFIVLFFIASFSYAQSTLTLNSSKSKIKYKAKHVLNSWEGTNNEVSGAIIFNEGISNIAVATKAIDFESGNSNRDLHLLEYLDLLKYPYIKYYSDEIQVEGNSIISNGEIEFQGKKKQIKILAIVEKTDNQVKIQGKLQLIPSQFLNKLPSFMLFEIEDYLDISFELYFDK